MNGRPLSQFIRNFFAYQAAMGSRTYNTHLAFLITLKTGATVNLSTHPLVITSLSVGGESVTLAEPLVFIGNVLSAPDIQFTQTDTSDGSTQMTVSNLDYLLTSLIPENDRLFDGAKVKVYLCFKKANGSFEGLVYSVGKIGSAEGDHEVAPFSFVSDISDKSVTGGGRELTQKCLNELGVNAGRSWCGATNLPVGATCSKVYDDEDNGCAFYGQQSQFQGVSFFNPNGLLQNYGGTVTGGGWIEPPIGCYDVESFFKTPTGAVHGRKIKAGDALENHLGQIALVETVEFIWSDHRYLIETAQGASAIVSASHPVLTAMEDERGTAIYSLLPSAAQNLQGNIIGNDERIYHLQKQAGIVTADEGLKIVAQIAGVSQMSEFTVKLASAGEVVKLGLTAPNTYLGGRKIGFYVGGHNNKPIYNYLMI